MTVGFPRAEFKSVCPRNNCFGGHRTLKHHANIGSKVVVTFVIGSEDTQVFWTQSCKALAFRFDFALETAQERFKNPVVSTSYQSVSGRICAKYHLSSQSNSHGQPGLRLIDLLYDLSLPLKTQTCLWTFHDLTLFGFFCYFNVCYLPPSFVGYNSAYFSFQWER